RAIAIHPAVAGSPLISRPTAPSYASCIHDSFLTICFAPPSCQVGNCSGRDRLFRLCRITPNSKADMTVGTCGVQVGWKRCEAKPGHILPMRNSLLNNEKFPALREFRVGIAPNQRL